MNNVHVIRSTREWLIRRNLVSVKACMARSVPHFDHSTLLNASRVSASIRSAT